MRELLDAGVLHADAMTVTGHTVAENGRDAPAPDREVIRAFSQPLLPRAGFVVLSGNLFDSAVIKVSVVDDDFRKRFLSDPSHPDAFVARAVVFEGPEDYHARVDDPKLEIDANAILVIRNCGPVGYPGSAEVVNMQPPAALIRQGVRTLPTMGDGRQSGTSGSPSILNVSPEAAVGGGLALLETGDQVRVDLAARTVDVLIPDDVLARRRAAWTPPKLNDQTPWQRIYRRSVGQLGEGGCLEEALAFTDVLRTRGEARHSH